MDETNKNLWNKTAAELTVADQLKVAVLAPIVTMGVMYVGAVAVGGAVKLKDKLSARKDAKKLAKSNEIVEVIND